jgi:hypothetical protein
MLRQEIITPFPMGHGPAFRLRIWDREDGKLGYELAELTEENAHVLATGEIPGEQ